MSTLKIGLRLSGNLPSPEELTQNLGVTPNKVLRRGARISKKRVQPVDLWSLDLVNCDTETPKEEEKTQLQQATIALSGMAPALAALDRAECNACLYISTIREEDRGGFSLPSELIAAAAAGNLSIETSILVMLDDDDPLSAPSPKTMSMAMTSPEALDALRDLSLSNCLEETTK